MTTRRPWILWGAALLVALLGVLAGPSSALAVRAVWMALQPHNLVFGWSVIAILGVASLVWLAASLWLFGRLQGPGRWIFTAAAAILFTIPIAVMTLEKPMASETITLSPADAQAWKTFRP